MKQPKILTEDDMISIINRNRPLGTTPVLSIFAKEPRLPLMSPFQRHQQDLAWDNMFRRNLEFDRIRRSQPR